MPTASDTHIGPLIRYFILNAYSYLMSLVLSIVPRFTVWYKRQNPLVLLLLLVACYQKAQATSILLLLLLVFLTQQKFVPVFSLFILQCVQEEIFGPVVVVLKVANDEEAIQLANDVAYGLAGSVWTKDVHKAFKASAAIRAGLLYYEEPSETSGTVWINDHLPLTSEMPHGGYKASGFGKDMSHFTLEGTT